MPNFIKQTLLGTKGHKGTDTMITDLRISLLPIVSTRQKYQQTGISAKSNHKSNGLIYPKTAEYKLFLAA